MNKQGGYPPRVISLGVRDYDKLEQHVGERFDVNKEHISDVSLAELNQQRAVEVVVVGDEAKVELGDLIESNPMMYRSYISIGVVTTKYTDLTTIPFDGCVTPPTHQSVVRDIKHLRRLTELKRKSSTVYHLTQTLVDIETNGSLSKEDATYKQLKQCKRELEHDFNQLSAQVCNKNVYSLFDAIEVAGGQPIGTRHSPEYRSNKLPNVE